MPAPQPQHPARSGTPTFRARDVAESFGADAARYDAARPGYPEDLVARVLADSAGRAVLDVGCGTGIASRQFQAAGCTVLGVEPDARMADFARDQGLPVEVATFETWESAGRRFDVVIAAQSWHWVDPVAGAVKAADVLHPGGRLAVFGHAYEPPPEVAEPFASALRRVVPDSPFADLPARRPVEMYAAMYGRFADAIRDCGKFGDAEQWRFEWHRPYTRDEWLALLPTTGGLTQVPVDKTREILDAVGQAIDSLGGQFTMQYATLAATAVRGR